MMIKPKPYHTSWSTRSRLKVKEKIVPQIFRRAEQEVIFLSEYRSLRNHLCHKLMLNDFSKIQLLSCSVKSELCKFEAKLGTWQVNLSPSNQLIEQLFY